VTRLHSACGCGWTEIARFRRNRGGAVAARAAPTGRGRGGAERL